MFSASEYDPDNILCSHIWFCSILLKLGIEGSILGVIIAIVSLSSKDPFKYYYIDDLNNYFNYIPNITFSYEKTCICNNKTLYHTCKEEDISKGCFNNFSDTIKNQNNCVRKLESPSFCDEIEESFIRNKGRKLSYIFSVNYQVIRKLSLANLIVTLSFIFLYIFSVIVEKKKKILNTTNI